MLNPSFLCWREANSLTRQSGEFSEMLCLWSYLPWERGQGELNSESSVSQYPLSTVLAYYSFLFFFKRSSSSFFLLSISWFVPPPSFSPSFSLFLVESWKPEIKFELVFVDIVWLVRNLGDEREVSLCLCHLCSLNICEALQEWIPRGLPRNPLISSSFPIFLHLQYIEYTHVPAQSRWQV